MIVGLIKTIFIILTIYFVVKVVGRIVIPFLLGGFVKKVNNQVRQQQEEALRQKKTKKDGEVTVNYSPKKEKNFGKDDGDYVDFEEIK